MEKVIFYNDENIEIEKVEAHFTILSNSKDTYIEILSKNGMHLAFIFNNKKFNPKQLERNKLIDLKNYIYWDVQLNTKESYYLFDVTKDTINLTRLDDNLFNIKVHIVNPDMIYSPSNGYFKNLIVDADFSFTYDDKHN